MKKFKPLETGLLKTNVYLLDRCSNSSPLDVPRCIKYESLVRKETPRGFEEVVEEFDYPITPESVNSYLDSCDYKTDPLGNLSRSSVRRNLGDITDLQNIASLDAESARALYRELLLKMSKKQTKNQVTSSDATTSSDVMEDK